jgi:glycosyltransferase involved in cell wall biosynthesis
MRILMVTPMLPHLAATSGGAYVMHGQLVALAARHQVTLATFAGPDPVDREALDHLRTSGLEVHAIWRPAPVGFGRYQRRWRLASQWLRRGIPLRTLEFWEPSMQHILHRLMSETAFDLIQVEDNAMGNYGYQPGLPKVLTEHEVRVTPLAGPADGSANRLRRALRQAEGRRWQRFQPAIWRRFDSLQVFTPRDAAAVQAMAPDLSTRLRINPFGVELAPAVNPRDEADGAVLFVGGFTHGPNVDAALWLGREIMPLLRASRPGVRLTVVGNQPPPAVRALAGEDIVVTGRVPTIEPYLRRAAVVLAPLRTGAGMRLKVLQAMAHGKAVVTTPLGAEGLSVASSEPPLVIASDAKEFADGALGLLSAEAARRQLGADARAFVARHHSWSAYQERLEALYQELMPKRVRAS